MSRVYYIIFVLKLTMLNFVRVLVYVTIS